MPTLERGGGCSSGWIVGCDGAHPCKRKSPDRNQGRPAYCPIDAPQGIAGRAPSLGFGDRRRCLHRGPAHASPTVNYIGPRRPGQPSHACAPTPWYDRTEGTRHDDQRGRRHVPGQPVAQADPRPPRLGDGGRCLRRRTRLPCRGGAPAPPARGGSHPTTLSRSAKPRRQHGTRPARPAHPDDREQGGDGMAKGSRLRRRSHAETAMFRYKAVIGSRLRARTLPAPKTETKVARSVLNRMARLGMPMSQRVC